jgi:hypothetical protein
MLVAAVIVAVLATVAGVWLAYCRELLIVRGSPASVSCSSLRIDVDPVTEFSLDQVDQALKVDI